MLSISIQNNKLIFPLEPISKRMSTIISQVKQVGKSCKYKLLKQIGCGGYGRVYQAYDQKQDRRVAVKIESQSQDKTCLIHQLNIYKILRPCRQVDYNIKVPHFYYCATEGSYNVLVMELLGMSLDKIMHKRGKLPLKTVLYFAQQMISILQYVHNKHVLHRDLKPSERKAQLFLIDFGTSKKYIYGGKEHISMKKVGYMVGSLSYASINAHKGLQQSRRDDLESLAYILIYFAKGSLPWKKYIGKSQQHILQMKQNLDINHFCKELPQSFGAFLHAVRNLSFEQQPNYEFYKNLFRLSFKLNRFSNDSFQIY